MITNYNSSDVCLKTIEYFDGDNKRIAHLMKVTYFSSLISKDIFLTDKEKMILEYASILHDTGIKKALELHNSHSAYYQELYGPMCVKSILSDFQIDEDILDEICYIVGNHHTLTKVNSTVFQILIEADFLVNAEEDNLKIEVIRNAYGKIFKTDMGKKLLKLIYKI